MADALSLSRFALVGHDWGARVSYIVSAVAPERVAACVALPVGWWTNDPNQPLSLRQAQNYWYHWLMALDRGAKVIHEDRDRFRRSGRHFRAWDGPNREITRFAHAIELPLNIYAGYQGVPTIDALAAAGVRRVSVGCGARSLRIADFALAVHPADATLAALRMRTLQSLRAKYQLNPFKFEPLQVHRLLRARWRRHAAATAVTTARELQRPAVLGRRLAGFRK